jgi:hypothetical protein
MTNIPVSRRRDGFDIRVQPGHFGVAGIGQHRPTLFPRRGKRSYGWQVYDVTYRQVRPVLQFPVLLFPAPVLAAEQQAWPWAPHARHVAVDSCPEQ